MERRTLLQSLVALPLAPLLIHGSKTASAAVLIPPGHYMIFVDPKMVDIDALMESGADILPENVEASIIPVRVHGGHTIDDAVRIYKIEEV
jgi:hypothetical protein